VLPDIGHVPELEAPREVTRALVDFIVRRSAPAG
jgi:hypothetical protein